MHMSTRFRLYVLVAFFCATRIALGATWTVNTLGEPATIGSTACPAACTLRDAINQAASGDTIQFDPSLDGQTIALTLFSNDIGTPSREFGSSAFFLTGNRTLTIDALAGLAHGVTITRSGASYFRLFDVDTGSALTLSGLTLKSGYAQGGAGRQSNGGGSGMGAGGAIFNQGTLQLLRCTLTGNTAQAGDFFSGGIGGGGVGQSGDFSGNGGGPNGGHVSTVSGNQGGYGGFGGGGGSGPPATYPGDGVGGPGGFGGGGGAGGNAVVYGVSGGMGFNGGFGGGAGAGGQGFGAPNGSSGTAGFGATGAIGAAMGGAVFNDAGNVTIENSTLAGNTAGAPSAGYGGALLNYNGTMTLDFVTLSGNSSTNSGGAIYSLGDSNAACSAGGNPCTTSGATLTMSHSIAANNSAGDGHDVDTNAIHGGGNSSSGTGNLIGTSSGFAGGIVSTANPQLGALADNGGPAQTMLPASGSPVIDAVTCDAVTIDERGVARAQGTQCDIGAVEYRQNTLSVTVTGDGAVSADAGSPAPLSGAISGCTTSCSATYSGETAPQVQLDATPGVNSVLSTWGGDCSGSAATTQVTMNAARNCTATFVLTSTNALGSSSNPSTFGQSVTFTATITTTAASPGGTVAFTDGVNTLAGCYAVALSGTQAQCTTSALGGGSHSIVATYSGDAGTQGSTSNTVSQTVNAAATTTTLSSPCMTTFVAGQPFTVDATISGANPTGTVTFDGGAAGTLCSGVAVSGGATSCQTSALPAQGAETVYQFGAAYSGDGNYASSQATNWPVTVLSPTDVVYRNGFETELVNCPIE